MQTRKVLIIVFDIVIYLIILISWRYVDSSVPKIQRGFICGDTTLSLPYKKSTIRGIWLHANFYATPIIISLIEIVLKGNNIKNGMKLTLKRSLHWFKFYFFAFISLIILMSTVKNLSVVHRPFFFDVCKPDLAVNCTKDSYVSADFKCTNLEVSEYLLSESTRSFPSGHVVSAVYSCCVFMWYLQTRISKFPMLLIFVHIVCLLWMAVCCATRITDNWHHVSDVIGAILITIPFIFYTCHVLCKNFRVKTNTVIVE